PSVSWCCVTCAGTAALPTQMVCALAGLPGGMWHTVVFLVSAGSQARGSACPGTHAAATVLSSIPSSAGSFESVPVPQAARPRTPARQNVRIIDMCISSIKVIVDCWLVELRALFDPDEDLLVVHVGARREHHGRMRIGRRLQARHGQDQALRWILQVDARSVEVGRYV